MEKGVVTSTIRGHPLKDVRVALLGRAPLERASSVPDNSCSANVALLGEGNSGRRSMKRTSGRGAAERTVVQEQEEEDALGANASVFGRLRTSLESIYRGASGSSINISRKSYERLMGTEPEIAAAAAAAVVVIPSHGQIDDTCNPPPSVSQPPLLPSNVAATHPPPSAPSVPTNERLSIRIDENNIPQIDVAITPPDEDHVTNRRRPGVAGALPRGGLSLGLRTGASGGHRRNRPQFTSMKVRRHRCDPLRRGEDFDDDLIYDESKGMFVSNPTVHCPTLTITMDVDDESLVSDYISPSPYFGYRGAGVPAGDGTAGSHCTNVGDEISLYGTPKEELSPFKDVDGARSSPSNYLKDQIISFFQPSDNKLAMKLFGNKNALMKEKLRQKEAGNWVIHPCSNFR